MASLFQRPSGTYYLSFHDARRRPARKQVSLRTRTHRTALVLRRRLEDAYALGEFDPWLDPDWTAERRESGPEGAERLGGAVAGFYASRAHTSPHTQQKYRVVLGGLLRHLGAAARTAAIATTDLAGYLAATDTKPVSRRSYAGSLSAFFNWAVAEGLRSDNPAAGLRLERVPDKHPRYLSEADVAALYTAIEGASGAGHAHDGSGLWLLPIVRANVYLGLRAGEVVHLRWDDVDLARRTLRVSNSEGFETKTGKERVLPLAGPPFEVLLGMERHAGWVFPSATGRRLHPNYLSRRFKQMARAAGLPDHVCFHTTRHTAASWLAERGVGVEAIRAYMGHSSVRVTEKYMHVSPQSLAAQVGAAFERKRIVLSSLTNHQDQSRL
ncbi:MAG: tyrosine-type recombinase/integrase [Bacteroidota bacterium]